MKTSDKNKRNNDYVAQYRMLRVKQGWKQFYRLVPPDLANTFLQLIARHKAEHFDVWHSIPKVNVDKK